MDTFSPMPSGKPSPSAQSLWKAFDEANFGAGKTLNLREGLPSAANARHRAEMWLRERQISNAKEVLVITGRGNNSPGGVSVVRESISALFPLLRRRGVIEAWREHTPGSFVVTLAPMKSLLAAPRRKRDRDTGAGLANPESLSALDVSTLKLLRSLALKSLDALGIRDSEKFVEDEMKSQFNRLAVGIPSGPDGEKLLRHAIAAALDEVDE